jgi:outer membrane protein TolC
MKRLIFLFFILCFSSVLFAQDSSFQSLNDDYQFTAKDSAIKEKLIVLALQNADKRISDYQVEMARQEVGLAKAGWLSSISASSYWNEFSINPPSKDQVNFYYPKYNFGVSVPLSIFITVPKNVKIARTQYHISKEEQKLKILSIRNQVLSKFEDYQMYKKQFTIQSIVTSNEYNAFLQIERKFRSGEVNISDYNKEMQNYNDELSKKISLHHDMAVAKLALEEIIGIDLNKVLNKTLK